MNPLIKTSAVDGDEWSDLRPQSKEPHIRIEQEVCLGPRAEPRRFTKEESVRRSVGYPTRSLVGTFTTRFSLYATHFFHKTDVPPFPVLSRRSSQF